MDILIRIQQLAWLNHSKMLNLYIIAAPVLCVLLAHLLMGSLAPWFVDIHGVHHTFLATSISQDSDATVGGGGPW